VRTVRHPGGITVCTEGQWCRSRTYVLCGGCLPKECACMTLPWSRAQAASQRRSASPALALHLTLGLRVNPNPNPNPNPTGGRGARGDGGAHRKRTAGALRADAGGDGVHDVAAHARGGGQGARARQARRQPERHAGEWEQNHTTVRLSVLRVQLPTERGNNAGFRGRIEQGDGKRWAEKRLKEKIKRRAPRKQPGSRLGASEDTATNAPGRSRPDAREATGAAVEAMKSSSAPMSAPL